MFGIFEKKKATPEDHAKAYVEIQQAEAELLSEHAIVKTECLDLTRRQMSGHKVEAELKKAKGKLDDLSMKIEACQTAMTELRVKINDGVVNERKARIADAKAEMARLKDEYADGLREVLNEYAKVISIDRKYRQNGIPVQAIATALSGPDMVYFNQLVGPAITDRIQEPCTELKIRRLSSEILQLTKTLETLNPEIETINLLEEARTSAAVA